MIAPRRICQSETYGNRIYCGRCDLSWVVNATGDDVPSCQDKAHPPITLPEIKVTADRQSLNEAASLSAMVKAGIMVAPEKAALRRIAVFRAMVDLVERCEGDAEIMRRLREG